MKEQNIRKEARIDADGRERRCLKCGKRVIGRWLCERCFKQNSTMDHMFFRYEWYDPFTHLP